MKQYSENYFTYIYAVKDQINEMSLKDYLVKNYGYSSRLISRIKREGQVMVNGTKVLLSYLVAKGDKIVVCLGEEHVDSEPEDIPLEIIYEDNDILVINKQAGIVTHATRSHPKGTLANAIANHWLKINVNAKIRFVNRLDRDTSGVIIIAKNKYSHQFIQNEMKKGKTEKIYLAIVEGVPLKEKDTIDAPIGRPNEDSIMRVVMEDGQRAVTHYQVLRKMNSYSLLRLSLETGRTHQIRVHLKSIGHPIVGDTLYNESVSEGIDRQALHAFTISFIHPRLQKKVMYKGDLHGDMRKLLKLVDGDNPQG